MELKNKMVQHKKFGKGKIVEMDGNILMIRFNEEVKKFQYPDAFRHHLELTEKKSRLYVENLLEDVDAELEIYNAELRKIERHKELLRTLTIHPCSQIAVHFDQNEKESFLTNRIIHAGIIKSGRSKGLPNRPIRLHQNSACILTALEDGAPEVERYIFGICMIAEDFIGRKCEDGLIPTHSKYYILQEPNMPKLLFWNYFTDSRYPEHVVWKSGKYKYCENMISAQILKDIVDIKKINSDAQLDEEFFRYFCSINKINIEKIPAPSGTLIKRD